MPAPHWFFRFLYDRESGALQRQHDQPELRRLDEETAATLARLVRPPGPIADLGCGPGPHAVALARRGYDVVGVDGSPRMIEQARERAARDGVDPAFRVSDLGTTLPFDDASLGGALAVLVLQHLPDPVRFLAEVRRCLRPGGHLLVRAPARTTTAPSVRRSRYYRVRAAVYTHVPGLVRFYDVDGLRRVVADAGLTVVDATGSGTSVTVVARA